MKIPTFVSGWENLLANVETRHASHSKEALQKGCLENDEKPTDLQESFFDFRQCLS
jgi:hypothetical protein